MTNCHIEQVHSHFFLIKCPEESKFPVLCFPSCFYAHCANHMKWHCIFFIFCVWFHISSPVEFGQTSSFGPHFKFEPAWKSIRHSPTVHMYVAYSSLLLVVRFRMPFGICNCFSFQFKFSSNRILAELHFIVQLFV